jgi:hypothetical protein
MKRKSVLRMSMVAVPTMIVCGLLVVASSARVDQERRTGRDDEDTKVCTNKTLQGDYAYTIEGTIISIPNVPLPPGVTLPLRGISLAHYDGKGNKTQVDHVVVNGQEPQEEWTPASGTYTVNEDCTGRQEVFIPDSPLSPIRSHFIIDKGGREIREVIDANAVTAIGSRVD